MGLCWRQAVSAWVFSLAATFLFLPVAHSHDDDEAPIEAPPESGPARERLLRLNTSMEAMVRQYRHAAGSGGMRLKTASISAATEGLKKDLKALAQERRMALQALIGQDPGQALALGFARLPDDWAKLLPVEVKNQMEGEVVQEGTLEVLCEVGSKQHIKHYFLTTRGGERLGLHFARNLPALQSGIEVKVSGLQAGNMMALAAGSSVYPILPVSDLLGTFGAQKTLVIMVNFKDAATQPYNAATVVNVMNSVSSFMYENSFHQTWHEGSSPWSQRMWPVGSRVPTVFPIAT